MTGKKKKTPESEVITKTVNVPCRICCKPIIEGHDEALLCEGSCSFLSSICSQFKQTAVIEEMQEKIDALTAEVIEVRSNVTDLCASLQLLTLVPAITTGGEPIAPTAAL